MFRRILIPIDETEHGTATLHTTVAIARRTGAQLVALYVESSAAAIEETTAVETRIRREIDELYAAGIHIKFIVGSGRPQDGIMTAIWDQHPSLVILVPHKRHGIDALRHPSTTHALITHARVPLLILPFTMDAQTCEKWLVNIPSPVIVPLDGSSLAEQAIPAAESFARGLSRTLLLFRAISPVLMPGTGLHVAQFERQALAAEEHEALHYLREIRNNLSRTSDVLVETMIAAGDPSAAILDLTQAHPGSLVAMSTNGRGGFARFVLGSVTFEVLARTSVPLLIVPPHRYAFTPAPEPLKEQESTPTPAIEFGNA